MPLRNLVVVGDVRGVVHFLNRDDGSFVARLPTDGSPLRAPLQRLGSNLLLQTSNGSVLAIEVQ
jgi:outer membrane protein assembly factor BamB